MIAFVGECAFLPLGEQLSSHGLEQELLVVCPRGGFLETKAEQEQEAMSRKYWGNQRAVEEREEGLRAQLAQTRL